MQKKLTNRSHRSLIIHSCCLFNGLAGSRQKLFDTFGGESIFTIESYRRPNFRYELTSSGGAI